MAQLKRTYIQNMPTEKRQNGRRFPVGDGVYSKGLARAGFSPLFLVTD